MDDILVSFNKFKHDNQDDYYFNKLLSLLTDKEYEIITYLNLKIIKIKHLLIYLSKECYCIVTKRYEYTFFIDNEFEINLLGIIL
jgi:hypothetical protein